MEKDLNIRTKLKTEKQFVQFEFRFFSLQCCFWWNHHDENIKKKTPIHSTEMRNIELNLICFFFLVFSCVRFHLRMNRVGDADRKCFMEFLLRQLCSLHRTSWEWNVFCNNSIECGVGHSATASRSRLLSFSFELSKLYYCYLLMRFA